MASSSFILGNPWLGVVVSEKLSRINHATWKAQVLAAVRGARLEGHLTGYTPAPAVEIDNKDGDVKDIKIANPLYEEWFATDQQILNFILGSLTWEILSQVAAKEKAVDLWAGCD
jgi:hypothetical protein